MICNGFLSFKKRGKSRKNGSSKRPSFTAIIFYFFDGRPVLLFCALCAWKKGEKIAFALRQNAKNGHFSQKMVKSDFVCRRTLLDLGIRENMPPAWPSKMFLGGEMSWPFLVRENSRPSRRGRGPSTRGQKGRVFLGAPRKGTGFWGGGSEGRLVTVGIFSCFRAL